jgi:hypothetical protein
VVSPQVLIRNFSNEIVCLYYSGVCKMGVNISMFVMYIPLTVPKRVLRLQLSGYLVVYDAANLHRNII